LVDLLDGNKPKGDGRDGIFVSGDDNSLGKNHSKDDAGTDFSLSRSGFVDLGGNKATTGGISIGATGVVF